MGEALQSNPDLQIDISTNSLASSDHFFVTAISLKQQRYQVERLNYNIHQLKPYPADIASTTPSFRWTENDRRDNPARYSIHAKSLVIDRNIAVVSTSNFDPRSAYLNTECAVMIEDPEFAAALEADIRRDMKPQNSWVVGKRKRIPIVAELNNIMGSISERLPVMDVWPVQYTRCYELAEGASPVAPDDPEFHQRFKDVGNFPQCKLSPVSFKTRITKALFGWISPIM